MGRGKNLSDEKGKIMAYKSEGRGNRWISRKIGRSHKVINRFVQNPAIYGTNKSPGRPKLLSDRTKRRILGEISNSTTSVRKLKNELALNVSKDTIHRVIKSSQHLVRQKPKACPVLTDAHKKARLQFATQHITWTHQWSTVIFGHLRI